MNKPTISIVVPCFNEEESIPLFYMEMNRVHLKLPSNFEFVFVDDGSTDNTLTILRRLAEENPQEIHYISFSRNFGKEAALYAGLKKCTGDYVAVMDVDLQDPPELLLRMYEDIQSPNIDCVGSRRTTRTGEPKIRSFFANLFYKIINHIGQTEMVDGARDFRLMKRQMVDSILEVTEYNRFSKGIFTWVGYNTVYLEYENKERIAGETSWNFWKLVSYSIDGIINYSDFPLNFASYLGGTACLVALISLAVIVIRTLLLGDATAGWPSLVSIILLLGGVQLLSLGIIGKYLGKIFLETKRRPIYIVKEQDKEI